jgi:hypothetical protein
MEIGGPWHGGHGGGKEVAVRSGVGGEQKFVERVNVGIVGEAFLLEGPKYVSI